MTPPIKDITNPTNNGPWLVVKLNASLSDQQRPKRKVMQLRNRGIETYYPLYEKFNKKAWGRNREGVRKPRPLLPGYCFIRIPQEDYAFLPILFELGLIGGLVFEQGLPVEVHPKIIRNMQRRFGGGKYNALDHERYMQTRMEFRAGDMVRINRGSLEGFEIQVTELTDTTARFVTQILGKETEQEVPISWLEAC